MDIMQKIQKQVDSAPIVLYMKGTPQFPQCGFSSTASQITNFLKTPLALLGVDLKNFQFNKICHFANHPYLCKGL